MKYLNSKNGMVGETASGLMLASARGLAKLAAYMANRGQLDGQVMLSEACWNEMHAEPTTEVMYGGAKSMITKAGFCLFEFPEEEEKAQEVPADAKKLSKDEKIVQKTVERVAKQCLTGREGYYGWFGVGGSVFNWHPELKIGFGYVPTYLNWLDLQNGKAAKIQ